MIQRRLQDPLAQLLLEGKIADGAKVKVSASKTGLTIDGQEFAAGADELSETMPLQAHAQLGVRRSSSVMTSKLQQLGGAEGGGDRGIGGVAAARHQDAADARRVVARIHACARRRPERPRTRR